MIEFNRIRNVSNYFQRRNVKAAVTQSVNTVKTTEKKPNLYRRLIDYIDQFRDSQSIDEMKKKFNSLF